MISLAERQRSRFQFKKQTLRAMLHRLRVLRYVTRLQDPALPATSFSLPGNRASGYGVCLFTQQDIFSVQKGTRMIHHVLNKRIVSLFLSLALLLGVFGSVSFAQHRRHRRHHHSRTKGAIIGGLAGAAGGALIGGRRGALIGGGAGAGTGYLIQRHRNKRHRRNY
jgi:YMGG-like Gly-zipper